MKSDAPALLPLVSLALFLLGCWPMHQAAGTTGLAAFALAGAGCGAAFLGAARLRARLAKNSSADRAQAFLAGLVARLLGSLTLMLICLWTLRPQVQVFLLSWVFFYLVLAGVDALRSVRRMQPC